jgi:hypothetical protein
MVDNNNKTNNSPIVLCSHGIFIMMRDSSYPIILRIY